MDFFLYGTKNVFSLPYYFNIFFFLAYCKYIVYNIQKHVYLTIMFVLRLLVNSRLLALTFWECGSQKLNVDFLVCVCWGGGLVSLIPVLVSCTADL